MHGRSCGCYSHNGFVLGTAVGETYPLALAEEKGLTAEASSVRLTCRGSVSALVEGEGGTYADSEGSSTEGRSSSSTSGSGATG